MRADQEEAHRAFWWRMLPRVDKGRALSLAHLDKSRADCDLSTFTIQERELIHVALLSHMARMEIIVRCTGVAVEPRPVVDGAATMARTLELEQQQEETKRRRQELLLLQEQEQGKGKGRLH